MPPSSLCTYLYTDCIATISDPGAVIDQNGRKRRTVRLADGPATTQLQLWGGDAVNFQGAVGDVVCIAWARVNIQARCGFVFLHCPHMPLATHFKPPDPLQLSLCLGGFMEFNSLRVDVDEFKVRSRTP